MSDTACLPEPRKCMTPHEWLNNLSWAIGRESAHGVQAVIWYIFGVGTSCKTWRMRQGQYAWSEQRFSFAGVLFHVLV